VFALFYSLLRQPRQVPKTMNEEDIFPTFDSFGPLKDVSIIRDKHTQLHRGCAFVTYWAASDAEKAQAELHGKHTFPGARRPAQVKAAEPSIRENKLFIGMLSKEATEEDIRGLFEPFGEIKEIFLIRNQDGSSKCAAFLRYVDKDSAEEAMKSMHSSMTMEGAQRPLIVKYADNKRQREQRHMRNIRRHELMATLAPGAYAYPPHMAMGPPGPGGHPHQYSMPGAHHPQYGPPYPAGGPHGAHGYHPHMYAPHQYGNPHHGPYGAFQNQPPGNRQTSSSSSVTAPGGNSVGGSTGDVNSTNNTSSRNPNPRPREGPAGANLFVYHLPHDLTDADLATAFNPFGNVISAKVYVDRFTGESKGFGFVSYDSVIAAESAIEQMNGFQIGNKRLKVQHKRVHGNHGSGGGSGGGNHHQQPYLAHTQMPGMMPLDASGPQVVLDGTTGQPHVLPPEAEASTDAAVPPGM
jgi:CUG-BP- and ETR3-like factor